MRKIDCNKFLSLLAISLQRIKQQHFIVEIPDEITTFEHPLMTKKKVHRMHTGTFFQANVYAVSDLTDEEISFLLFYVCSNEYIFRRGSD